MRRIGPLFALLSALFFSCLLAQTSPRDFGRTLTKEDRREWESPVLPNGIGLPLGSGNAVGGEVIYAQQCAGCHGERGEGVDPIGPQLVGGIGSLRTSKPTLTVGSYWPYSTSIWDYIHRAMPYPAPGTLTVDETYAVTAYVLYLNNLIEKSEVMDRETLPHLKMPNRNGFISKVPCSSDVVSSRKRIALLPCT